MSASLMMQPAGARSVRFMRKHTREKAVAMGPVGLYIAGRGSD